MEEKGNTTAPPQSETPKWDANLKENLKEPEFTIKLENYKRKNNNRKPFVGREKEILKLIDILKFNWSYDGGGAYLVTGYRGVGKTEFVKKTLDKYEDNLKEDDKSKKAKESDKPEGAEEVLQVHISLGNEDRLDSKLVLNNIVSLMLEEFEGKFRKELCRSSRITFFLILPLLFLLLLLQLPITELLLQLVMERPPTQEKSPIIYWDGILLTLVAIVVTVYWRKPYLCVPRLDPTLKIYRRLSLLLTNMTHASEKSHGMNFKGLFSQKKYSRKALNNNEIELELKNILKIARESGLHVIFVFDELDKLTNRSGDLFEPEEAVDNSERRNRKRQVDNLLGELKGLTSTTQATYIFISGRDMYDAYLSEIGSPNSLYESLFKDHIYIPSLLTDHSDEDFYLLDSMIEHVVVSQILPPQEKQKELYLSLDNLEEEGESNNLFFIKIFIHFLALHSWGNYKRIITIFDSFVVTDKEDNNAHKLEFKTKDIQRMVLASHLYILFHHHLARVFINADDKLIVSSLAVFHYIMKFHDIGFSRSHINRMYQTVNVHSSPELNKVVEIIINKVLNNHIRRVRNSYYRYRFSSLYEQEIRYITTISEKESAAFNFSLDAMDAIKRTYKKMLNAELSKSDAPSKIAAANLHVILGNFYFWEQSFDQANTQYQSAISIYENEEKKGCLERLMALVEAYMKRASVEEQVGNYSLSAAIYAKAIDQVEQHCNKSEVIEVKDSKMDMLKQPYWALKFLHLKRSAIHYTESKEEPTEGGIYSLFNWQAGPKECSCKHRNNSKKILKPEESYYSQFIDTDTWRYRGAVFKFYMGQADLSYECFMSVAKRLDVLNAHNERSCYLGGKTLLRAGYSLLIAHSKEAHQKMRSSVLKLQSGKHSEEEKYQKRMLELTTMLEQYLPFMQSMLEAIESKKSLEGFRESVVEYENGKPVFKTICPGEDEGNGQNHIFPYAIGLLFLSATTFEKSRLNTNSAVAYLSVVKMWTLFMEMLPWRFFRLIAEGQTKKHTNDPDKEKFKSIVTKFKELQVAAQKITIKNNYTWIEDAGKFAFERNSYATSKAMSHSAKVLLRRGNSNNDGGLFTKCASAIDMVNDPQFYETYLYQHYSMFGQMTLSSVKWENFSSNHLNNDKPLGNDDSWSDGNILPFSVRYYSTMLWLQGRNHLKSVVTETNVTETKNPIENPKKFYFNKTVRQDAIKALVKFYRASQYVVKTAGESSNAVLPPLFMIYYNMWEVVFHLVESLCNTKEKKSDKKLTYKKAVDKVVVELVNTLEGGGIKDISSRILDLSNLTVYTLDHFSIALKMGDANSREATSTLQSKYYLDDDFEDDVFTLDWSYTQIFAPGAYIHSQTIKMEMARLQMMFKEDAGTQGES